MSIKYDVYTHLIKEIQKRVSPLKDCDIFEAIRKFDTLLLLSIIAPNSVSVERSVASSKESSDIISENFDLGKVRKQFGKAKFSTKNIGSFHFPP
jgi:hypothetical protein